MNSLAKPLVNMRLTPESDHGTKLFYPIRVPHPSRSTPNWPCSTSPLNAVPHCHSPLTKQPSRYPSRLIFKPIYATTFYTPKQGGPQVSRCFGLFNDVFNYLKYTGTSPLHLHTNYPTFVKPGARSPLLISHCPYRNTKPTNTCSRPSITRRYPHTSDSSTNYYRNN